MMKRQTRPLRTNAAIVAASFLLGASAFSLQQAHACDKRGRELGEEFALEVVESTIEGEPRIANSIEVGATDVLYKNGRKTTRVVLSLLSLQFERASQ